MREVCDCEYMDRCIKTYCEKEMDEYRKNCDCVNCALCDRYWLFYDKDYLKDRINSKGENNNE